MPVVPLSSTALKAQKTFLLVLFPGRFSWCCFQDVSPGAVSRTFLLVLFPGRFDCAFTVLQVDIANLIGHRCGILIEVETI